MWLLGKRSRPSRAINPDDPEALPKIWSPLENFELLDYGTVPRATRAGARNGVGGYYPTRPLENFEIPDHGTILVPFWGSVRFGGTGVRGRVGVAYRLATAGPTGGATCLDD